MDYVPGHSVVVMVKVLEDQEQGLVDGGGTIGLDRLLGGGVGLGLGGSVELEGLVYVE